MPVHPKLAASIAALAALAASACASVPPGQPLAMRPAEPVDAPAPDFTDQGRIQFTPQGSPGAGAAWDARYVRGPAVNMALTDEGLWGGTIRGRAALLKADGGRITGEGVNLYVTQEGPVVHVQGLWFGNMLRIDVSPTKLSASPTMGVCGIEMALADDGYWRGFGGCGGRITYTWMTLHGVAGAPSAEMPQWLFAFLGSLPSPQTTVFPTGILASAQTPNGYLPAEFRGSGGWPLGWTGWGIYQPSWALATWSPRVAAPWLLYGTSGATGIAGTPYYSGRSTAMHSGVQRTGAHGGGGQHGGGGTRAGAQHGGAEAQRGQAASAK